MSGTRASDTPISATPAGTAALLPREPMIEIEGLHKHFGALHVLRGIDLSVAVGEVVCIIGPSGSGKSTLLGVLAGLLRPTAGKVTVGDQDLSRWSGPELDRWRGRHVGYVPQRLHLVASLSVLENLLLAPYLAGAGIERALIGRARYLTRVSGPISSLRCPRRGRIARHSGSSAGSTWRR